jgi:hypothetical protein
MHIKSYHHNTLFHWKTSNTLAKTTAPAAPAPLHFRCQPPPVTA